MGTILLFLGGGLIGGALAWLFVSSRLHKKYVSERREIEDRVVAAETKVKTLEQQVQDLSSAVEKARQELTVEQKARILAETKLSEATKNLEEQRKLLEKAQQELVNAFKALSSDALKSNNQAFLELAKQSLETFITQAKGDFASRQEAISGLVRPLEDALKRYENKIHEIENSRIEAYGDIKGQLQSLATTQQALQREAGNLVSALRKPEIRGRWGELTLKRVVELSGMSEHCDYVEQLSVQTEEGRLQPDMVVRLPVGRQVVVDAKTPLDAYLDATEALDEETRRLALIRHAAQVRKHMGEVSSKAYWAQFPQAPEFVVMFIPGESFFSAALENDRTLIEDGLAGRVFLATPVTLIALLRAVAYGWRQEQIAKNAQEIADLGRETYKRVQAFLGHIEKTRSAIEQSVFSFNRMVGSLEGRVMPGLRKFRDLGATGEEELPVIEPIEQTPRPPLALQPEGIDSADPTKVDSTA